MTSKRSRITSSVDLVAPGKRHGYLNVPWSGNESAWGTVRLPITVVRGGDGPTVLLIAGNHGDEYEGQITLARLIRDLDPGEIQGRAIVLPACNLPAALAGTRCSPIDGGNLNRSFPGDPDGGPTAAIAHYIETVLMRMADAVVDLHSGGKTLDYTPSALVRRRKGDDPIFERKLAALKAFRAPIGYMVFDAREDRTATAAADRNGVVAVGTELGGAGTVTLETLKVARRGVRNMLAHFGLTEAPPAGEDAGPEPRLMEVKGSEYYVHSPCRGLFEPAFELGDEVGAGQTAGHVHFIDDPAAPPVEVRFEGDGLVICKRPILQVERGDCLAHLATDYAG